MTQSSEAACLLQTGTTYTRRMGLSYASGQGNVVFAGFKHGAFSLYFGDEPIYHFDLEGRWQRAYISGTHYLKALDNSVVAIDRVREEGNLVLHRRTLTFAEASDLDVAVRAMAIDLIGDLNALRVEPIEPPAKVRPIAPEELCEFLERIVKWDVAAWFAQREHYLGTYGPWGFLPPEAQQAVVLQATLGNAEGLTFGGAAAAEHYVRSPAEFEEHVTTVGALLGRRIVQCRSVHVGGSDLLHRPQSDVESYLRAIARIFPIDPSGKRGRLSEQPEDMPRIQEIIAFLDDFRPPLPGREGLRLFQGLHLRRVVLGVESGDEQVRRLYRKTWAVDQLQAAVNDMRAAEIQVSIALLVGAGGLENSENHRVQTAHLINSLDLGPGDLVYLIDEAEVAGDQGRRHLLEHGLSPLNGPALDEQRTALRHSLAPVRTERRAKVVPYSLSKLWA